MRTLVLGATSWELTNISIYRKLGTQTIPMMLTTLMAGRLILKYHIGCTSVTSIMTRLDLKKFPIQVSTSTVRISKEMKCSALTHITLLHTGPIPDDREVEENRPKYNVSNGFIVRGNKAQDRTGGGGNMDRELKKGLTASQKHQRHLVLGRDFEDILEACRPRNRGDGGAPPSLLSQLKLFGLLGEKSRNNISNIIEGDEIIDKVQETPTEWNSVNLDDPSLSPGQSLLSAHNGSPNNLSLASSDFSAYSTQSLLSSFTNKHSVMLGRSPSMTPLGNMKIQLSSSIDIPFAIADVVRGTMKKSRSNGSLPEEDSIVSSCDSGSISNWQGKVWSLEAMRKAMDFHDSNIIYNEPSEFPEVESRHVAQSKSL